MDQADGSGNESWAGDRVTRWLRQADALERQLAPVSKLLFDAAAITTGDSVLDIGCGAGPTTREAAARSGASGRVTGLDVSQEMVSAAAAHACDGAPIEWIVADAVTWSPPPEVYDVVISRFGVMFFSDPAAAVATMATATRHGGRLTVAVWGRREESIMFDLPYRITVDVLTASGAAVPELPTDAGPFSWHDASAVTAMLGAAGWQDVRVSPLLVRLPFGGGVDADSAARAALDFGPTRTVLSDAHAEGDGERTAAVQRELSAAFADHLDESGHVVLEAAVRIVTARR